VKWTTATLGEIAASVDYGLTASATTLPEGPKFLRITDIQNNFVDWDSVPFCQATAREEIANSLAPGDIVFARTGATTGKSFLLRNCPKRAVFASYLIRVRPSDQVDATYLSKFFQSENYWAQIQKSARGAAQPGVNSTVLKELSVPFPPLDEQRRIAVILDQADDLRRYRQKSLLGLATLASSVVSTTLAEIQKSQQATIKLKDFVDIVVGFPFPSEQYFEGRGGMRLCRGANVLPDRIDWSDTVYWPACDTGEYEKFRLQADDILVAMDRPWISEGFKVTRLSSQDVPSLLVQRVARLRPKERGASAFVLELLKSAAFTHHCKPTETTVPHISPIEIREFSIPRPTRKQLETIDCRLSEIDTLKARHRAHLAELDALFASLQHRAFRGEL
jgi:type I restriction enzyme S subunit